MAAGLVLLADPDLEVIERYGLGHGTLGEALARPAAFLIGPDRNVKWRALPRTWRHRLDAQEVMELYRSQGGSP